MLLARLRLLVLLPATLFPSPPLASLTPASTDVGAPLAEGDPDDALVVSAHEALARETVDAALPWVHPQDQPLPRAAFVRAVAVRRSSQAARVVADEYFVLTLRRLHQISGSGQTYEGDARVDAAIAQAVSTGRAEPATRLVIDAVERGAADRMKRVLATRKKTGGRTAAARLAYVDACLEFARYVERLAIAADDALDPDVAADVDGPE